MIGKPYDTATGLYNYGYRDYQPQAARFTTIDPVRDGRNWFAYVNNDPVNWVDPWGLEAEVHYFPDAGTVDIYLPMTYVQGSGLSDKDFKKTVDTYNQGITNYWTTVTGDYDVRIYVYTPEKSQPTNTITVMPGNKTSFVNGIGGNTGTWYANGPTPAWTGAHEAGHLMGLGNQFEIKFPNTVSPGWEGNIMGERGGVVDYRNIQGTTDQETKEFVPGILDMASKVIEYRPDGTSFTRESLVNQNNGVTAYSPAFNGIQNAGVINTRDSSLKGK
jgi:RHS repeat-associated protein